MPIEKELNNIVEQFLLKRWKQVCEEEQKLYDEEEQKLYDVFEKTLFDTFKRK